MTSMLLHTLTDRGSHDPEREVIVYRGVTRWDLEDETWFLTLTAGLADALNSTSSSEVPQIIVAIARRADLKDVNEAEALATIKDSCLDAQEIVPIAIDRETLLMLANVIDRQQRQSALA